MRVAVDVRVEEGGYPGIARRTGGLVDALLRSRSMPELQLVLVHHEDPPGEALRRRASLGARLVRCPTPLRTARDLLWSDGVRRRLQADLLELHYFAGPLRVGIPRLVHVHDLIPIRVRGAMSGALRRAVYGRWLRTSIRGAAAVVVPSRATARELGGWIGRGSPPVHVVPGGVGDEFRTVTRPEIERVRSAFGLGGRYVLAVGSERPHKNLPLLVRAWSRRADRAAALVLVGSRGEDSRRLDSLLSGDGADGIRRLGRVADADLRALVAGATSLVVPSLAEGFGLPAVEAMAAGTAVAVSDVPAHREVVLDAGIFFDPLKIEAVAEAFERILGDADLRRRLEARGRERSRELDWEAAAEALLRVYASVSDGRAGGSL